MDDGALFQSSEEGTPTNRPCKKGDVVKCSVRAVLTDAVTHCEKAEITFSCNGTQVTSVLNDIPSGGFYGVIGMMGKNEKITLSPPMATQKLSFQEVWSIATPQLISNREDGICMYTGVGNLSERSIGSIRGKKSVDPRGDVFQRSFSLCILNHGEKDYIAIGVVDKDYPVNLLPGWEATSIGYHADTGDVFQSSGDGHSTGHPCTKGDVMECVVHAVDNSPKQVRVVFLRNSIEVMAITSWTPQGGFYFCFGMMSKSEIVQVILPEIHIPFSIPKLDFEEVWEVKNANIEHRGSGICHYIGNENVGTVRSKSPMDPFSSANSFEVKILNPGENCYIALGVCSPQYSTDDLPGWDDLSVGFHADNGCILQKSGGEERTENPCSKGDVIRCTLEPVDGSDKQMSVIFQKNGHFIGKSIFWKPGGGKVFAQVGCMSNGEIIQISSPLQKISHLRPDLTATPVTPVTPGPDRLLHSMGGGGAEEVSQAHGYHVHPHAVPYQDQMHKFFYTMYHHMQNSPQFRGQTMPLVRPPPPPIHPGAYHPPPGLSPFDHSLSYPPPDGHGTVRRLVTQQSEPAPKEHFELVHSSPSTSDSPSLSSQFSVSSQFSTLSHEAIPEESDLGLVQQEKSDSVSIQFYPPLQLTDSSTPRVPAEGLQQATPDSMSHELPCGAQSGHDSFDFCTPTEDHTQLKTLATEESSASVGLPSCNNPMLLQRSSSIIIEPSILSKDESKRFKIMHNTTADDDSSLEYVALHADSPDNSFIMFRLPLNEKIKYFQVEIMEENEHSNVAVGLVWDHYPVYHLPGVLGGSVAFHTKNSALIKGGKSLLVDNSFSVGDVLGCRAALQFKSEALTSLSIVKNQVSVEFFKNGLLLCTESIFLSPNGFFPAIGLTGFGTKVKVDQNIRLSPSSYFETHSYPLNHCNFPAPPQLVKGWQCLQSSRVDENHLFVHGKCCGQPSVVQNLLPFSSTATYFQVQLQCEISAYSVLSVGASPKLLPDSPPILLGESHDSICFLPLLGFIMSKGTISCTIAEVVSSSLYVKNTTIGIGIEMKEDDAEVSDSLCNDKLPSLKDDSGRVRLFFTINEQEVSSIVANLPKGGFFPTLIIESDCNSSGSLAKIEFPMQFPCVNSLPLGFVRGAEKGFLMKFDSYTLQDQRGIDESVAVDKIPVRALQAAQPLSPSNPYFETRIVCSSSTDMISCGVASFNYPLDVHPGCQKYSIAFHAADGNVFHNGSVETVAAACNYSGALIGCGARFPTNRSTTCVEIFFTINRKVVSCKLVHVPQMGLFPTIGMKTTGGMISIDLGAPDPYIDLKFKFMIGLKENVKVDGSIIELMSSSNPGAFQLKMPMSIHEPHYFTATCLSDRNGRVMIGFATNASCPLNFLKNLSFKACVIDIVTGKLMICNRYLTTKETCVIQDCTTFGVGIRPLQGSERSLLFFTANGYIVSYVEVDIEVEEVYPCVLMMDSTTRLKLDVCSVWPKVSQIGCGWARFSNLKLTNSQITHSSLSSKKRLPVGFAQASYPLTSKKPYFEVEICSRATNKAVAIGLASMVHPSNQWIGWSKGSIGYHSDDGRLFKESTFGQSFGPKAHAGDIIGCGARFNHQCFSDALGRHDKAKLEVYFTINGALLNVQKVIIPPGGFFPTICLESPSESVIFYQHDTFPPVSSIVNPEDWANAYSVHQIGRIIKNCCRHKEINGGLPKAFCQARCSITSEKPCFEVDIVKLNDSSKGRILVGASVKIAPGCTTPNTHSIMYSSSGHIIIRKGSQKYTREIQKAGVGDCIGCAVVWNDEESSDLHIYINRARLFTTELTGPLKEQDVYPTIVLTHPGDSVKPYLQQDVPVWDHSGLIGWLRSERVKLSGNIVEFAADSKASSNVGVAQIRHPFKLDNSASYYEVEVIDPGERCTIAVGVASAEYPLNMQPGWCKNSIAYHGDDGKLFHESGIGIPFASSWQQHDVIGLGIRSLTGKCLDGDPVQVYFTKNGVEVGHTTVCIPASGLFPTIGFHSAGEKVRVSLGTAFARPCNFDSIRLHWQALSGMFLQLDRSSGAQVLQYRNNGRTLKNPGIIVSTAIYGKSLCVTQQYFEIEFLKIGSIGIAVGVVPVNYPLDQAPGWSKDSVAYHTDNGMLYSANTKGKEFGPVAHCGDIVGCGISFTTSNIKHCSVFFTYNGVEIGRIRASCPPGGLYPAVALTDHNDCISIKFNETFKPKFSSSELNFVGLMRINNCSYSEQIVKFTGSGSSGYCSSPAVAQFAVPLSSNRNYFSMNVVGFNDSILIGLAVRDYPLRYAPGTTSISLAYDILKGCIKAVFNSDDFRNIDAPIAHVVIQ